MPKTHNQRSHRSPAGTYRKSKRSSFFIYSALLLIVGTMGVTWWISQVSAFGIADTTYDLRGKPTISADLINQVLEYYHSPARGKGQTLYNLGVKYDVDPVYALAFFMHESSFGTTGVARVTRSLGNIRATPGYRNYQGYRRYSTWEQGFADWYKLITVLYIGKWGLTTVDQIIPVYAPSSDNNDVAAYIRTVKGAVDTWRGGSVSV